MHVIAAKAVAFGEALKPEFKTLRQGRASTTPRALAEVLVQRGLAIVSGGTDSHVMLVDLRPKGVTGKATEAALEHAGITCNKNGVPFDPKSLSPSPPACGSAARSGPRAASAWRSSA